MAVEELENEKYRSSQENMMLWMVQRGQFPKGAFERFFVSC